MFIKFSALRKIRARVQSKKLHPPPARDQFLSRLYASTRILKRFWVQLDFALFFEILDLCQSTRRKRFFACGQAFWGKSYLFCKRWCFIIKVQIHLVNMYFQFSCIPYQDWFWEQKWALICARAQWFLVALSNQNLIGTHESFAKSLL